MVFFFMCVCVDTHCFILCLSVPVDECLLVADYTRCKEYVQLNLWIKLGFIQCICTARCELRICVLYITCKKSEISVGLVCVMS